MWGGQPLTAPAGEGATGLRDPSPGRPARQACAVVDEEASLLGIQKAALVTHIRRTYYCDDGRPVEAADIVVPAAHCEIVYEIPINR